MVIVLKYKWYLCEVKKNMVRFVDLSLNIIFSLCVFFIYG